MWVKILSSLQKPSKIILGVDPGTLFMGYSIIEVQGNTILLKQMEVLKLPLKKNNYERLQLIHKKIEEVVKLHMPHECAIEAPFFGKNVQTMLKLGRAQGVAIAAVMNASIPVIEYSPKKVKQSITGNGNANKEQIWKMLQRLLILPEKPKYFDATDALAVAVCHHFQSVNLLSGIIKRMNGWEEFVRKNPERLNPKS